MPLDNTQFLQHLIDFSLEEGHAYIQSHLEELSDYDATGNLIADEALRLRDTSPFISLKLAKLLTFLGESAPHTLSRALGLKAQGDALDFMGQFQAALTCLDMAAEEFLQLEDAVNWARTRIAWILSCAWLGRVDEALREAARARSVLLQNNKKYWACVVDHNTAVIYSQTGQYAKALELYERILKIFPTITDESEITLKRAAALAEMNQARNLGWLGDFEQAYRLLLKAQASFTAIGQVGQMMNTEFNLAEIDYAQGYYGSALRRYYQLRDDMAAHNFNIPELLASIMLRMATCLMKLNRNEEACRLADEAVEIYRQLGTSLLLGDALREYASILIASNRRRQALAALDQASQLFTRGGFNHHAATTRLQQAELHLSLKSYDTAYEQARIVNAYFEEQGLISRAVRASLVMAESLIERAQEGERHSPETARQGVEEQCLQEAALLAGQAGTLAEQHNLLEQAYKSQYLLGRLAFISGDVKRAAECYNAAIDHIEYILDDLVYDLSPSFLHTTWAVYEDMIVLYLRQGRNDAAFSYLERARSMALRQYMNRSRNGNAAQKQQNSAARLQIQSELDRWQEKYHQYSMQLAAIDSSASSSIDRSVLQSEQRRCELHLSELFERLYLYEPGLQVAPYMRNGKRLQAAEMPDAAQLRQHLLPGQLLLAYFLSKGTLFIFAMTANEVVVHENAAGGETLERLLPSLFAHLEPGGWLNAQKPPQAPIRRLLNKLYQLMIAPVSALLPPPSGSLTIVPYGQLHKLPFHALYDGAHFLIEDFQINYLPASFFLHLNTREPEPPAAHAALVPRTPLILGYSDHGQVQCVVDEAKALAGALDGRCYLEEEATIARLKEEAHGSPIIHLATHGHSRLDSPNFSYVRLADGQLNAIDAFNLNLEGCELVTLSGCETGLALSSGGDEQLGLGRAFLASGVSSLVMSLWPVEDNATSTLMQRFYQRLLHGDSKVQALRAAQCSLLQSASSEQPAYAHPYFWAAFRLVGDTGPLQYTRQREISSAIEIKP